MTVRGSLFIKVFIGFWLITVTVLGSWLLANQYFDTLPGSVTGRGDRPGPPPQFMLRLSYSLQNAERDELAQLVRQAKQKHDLQIFLIDRSGKDILGAEVPPAAARLAARRQGPSRRHRVIEHRGVHYAVQSIYRQDTGPLKAVVQWRPPRAIIAVLGSSPLLRLALAILISGLLCYLFSRMVTHRLRRLRVASKQLSAGELDTRIAVRTSGGDETDELARDFNQMADDLQRRIESQKQLLADVSHELRSPLARLRIALALAQDQPERYREYLQRVEDETGRLDELIAQLLSAQVENTVLDRHIDLAVLLQGIARDAQFEAEPQNKQIELNCKVDQAVVASTQDLLHKCLENIVRNAIKHTPRDSAVKIALSRDGDLYRISIQDAGPGVPEQDLDRIFEPFYRLDDARSRDSGGHGLGLAIARRIAEQHGGTIYATNGSPGLKITLSLPVFEPD